MKWMFTSPLLALVLSCAGLVGCGAGSGDTEIATNTDLRTTTTDTSDVLFERNRVLQIDIEMDPHEYDLLRGDGRVFAHLVMNCADEFEYSHFKASVSVDGEVLENVDVRKEGFLGSLTAARPSFKLNFDTHEPGRRLQGLERMTLNNNLQDPGNTHQCITYDLFRAAGLAAPRCSFARVSVNGEDLGIYTHVESIKKHFLRRNFTSDGGNLYESQRADFGEFTKNKYQLKTNQEENDRSDLDRVVEALSADDDNMPALLGQVVDLEQFIDFWAMEAITGHWDGATGNANNHLIYREPNSGLFTFIPWGTDGAMGLLHRLNPGTGPLYRFTSIPNRLYAIPEYREKIHQRTLALLDELWDAEALHAEVSRIRDLTGAPETAMVQTRNFIDRHESRLRASIAGELEQREELFEDQLGGCQRDVVEPIKASFTAGSGLIEFTDEAGALITMSAFAQPPTTDNPGILFAFNSYFITLIGSADGVTRILWISTERSEFAAGEVFFQGGISWFMMIKLDDSPQGGGLEAWGGPGSITYTETPVLGEPASFELSAELWFLGDTEIPGN